MKNEDEKAPRARIALVDDEGEFRAILRRWLAPRYDTMSFLDAEDLLESEPDAVAPDLIISDVMMPGMDGYRLRQTLRGDPRYASVPVLFLTSLDSDEAFLHGMEAGGEGYLAKPVERERLLECIEQILAVHPPKRQD